MKQKHLPVCLITALLTAPFVGASARAATITVEIIATFDYPGAIRTYAYAINNNNEIAGSADTDTAGFGFTRAANGQFSEPIVDPDDTHMFTLVLGLNDSGTVCGSFWGADTVHGFFLSDGTYTTYDVPGETDTAIRGINNAGDFVGTYFDPVSSFQGFISVAGTVTRIDITGGTYITPSDLNSGDQVVGSYSDALNGGSGFYSDTSGQLHYPIKAPHAKNTFLDGINDQGVMVGGYATQTGHNRATHGLLFIAPNKFVTVDYPGSSDVVFTGINNKGFICGYYRDSNNNFHGLVARARRTAE
jgi:hypothetical protein